MACFSPSSPLLPPASSVLPCLEYFLHHFLCSFQAFIEGPVIFSDPLAGRHFCLPLIDEKSIKILSRPPFDPPAFFQRLFSSTGKFLFPSPKPPSTIQISFSQSSGDRHFIRREKNSPLTAAFQLGNRRVFYALCRLSWFSSPSSGALQFPTDSSMKNLSFPLRSSFFSLFNAAAVFPQSFRCPCERCEKWENSRKSLIVETLKGFHLPSAILDSIILPYEKFPPDNQLSSVDDEMLSFHQLLEGLSDSSDLVLLGGDYGRIPGSNTYAWMKFLISNKGIFLIQDKR